MRKTIVTITLFLLCSAVFAQSAKNAVQVNYNALVTETCGQGWSKIAEVTIKTSQQKDLVMGASLETNLVTSTTVRSKGGTSDTSTATAELKVRVRVDNTPALPGEITFDRRHQELMAKFGGVFSCTDLNGDGIITFDECSLSDEELKLLLDTKAAHAFNFILPDVGVGTHTVTMEGCVLTATTTQAGQATATATAGKGSLTVEEVRLVKAQDVVF